jgi:PPK2 family polyphosphate:nucleotide phosphotransferase
MGVMKNQPVVVKGRIKLKQFDPAYCDGMDKKKVRAWTEKHDQRIGDLQQLLYANANRALLLIFQGIDASGKDGSIRAVLQHVNPAGVQTANFKVPSDEEKAHDYLWRVHKAVPRLGDIGVFNRSHYEAVLVERVMHLVPRKVWSRRYRQIVDFERMLAENGVVLLKFYLHISRKEQAARFKDRLANPKKNWKFSPTDLTTRRHWDAYIEAYQDMLNATSHAGARWHLVPADRNWYRDYVVAKTVVRALEGLKMKWPEPAEDLSKVRFK